MGALLVAAAIVATFVAYLDAVTVPTREVVIATEVVDPGTQLSSMDEVAARFGTVEVELQEGEATQGLVPADEVEALVGRTVVAPLQRGDLLLASQVVADGGIEGAHVLSFALPRTAAVGGSLQPGERIDVLGTFGSGETAYTAFVARSVPVLRVTAPDGGAIGSGAEITLTVAITAPGDVQALGHAVNTANVFVVRSRGGEEGTEAAPGAYRAEPREQGPRPEPAGPLPASAGSDQ